MRTLFILLLQDKKMDDPILRFDDAVGGFEWWMAPTIAAVWIFGLWLNKKANKSKYRG